MNRIRKSEVCKAMSAISFKFHLISVASCCRIYNSTCHLIIHRYKSVYVKFLSALHTISFCNLCIFSKNMLNTLKIPKSFLAYICTENNISTGLYIMLYNCLCDCNNLSYSMCIVINSRTIISVSFFFHSHIRINRKDSVRMCRKHDYRPFSCSMPGSKHISHLINMNI